MIPLFYSLSGVLRSIVVRLFFWDGQLKKNLLHLKWLLRSLLLSLALSPNLAIAQNDPCTAIQRVIQQSNPDYSKLNKLKKECSEQLEKGPNAIFIKTLEDFHFQKELQAAHQKRIVERRSLSQQLLNLMKRFGDTRSSQDLVRETNQFFVHQLDQLQEISHKLEILKKTSLDSYLSSTAQVKLKTVRSLPTTVLNSEAVEVLEQLDADQNQFSQESDVQITKFDRLISEYIKASIKTTTAFQANANYKASRDQLKDFQNGVSLSVLKLQATTAWGKFLLRSNLNTILLKVDVNLAAGFINAGKEKIKFVDQSIEVFLANLPRNLAGQIKEADSFKKTKQDNDNRFVALQKLNPNLVLERQKVYLESQAKRLKDIQNKCSVKYPKFANQINQVQQDHKNLPAILKSGSAYADDPTTALLLEALGERSEIILELCKEFGP